MAYLTPSALEGYIDRARLIRLTDLTNADEPDSARLTREIAAAGDVVDSYLSGRMATPLAEPAEAVRQAVASIVLFRLWVAAVADGEAPDGVKSQHDRTIRWLQDLASGAASLTVAAEPLGEAVLVGQSCAPPNTEWGW